MKRSLNGALCALLCSSCAVGCGVRPPGRIETRTMYWVKRNVTIGGGSQLNPVSASHANVDAGKQAFGYYCVSCHGRDGQNTGVPFAANMAPPIPSLASREVQAYSDGQLKWIIDHGVFPSGMPASKGLLSDEEMWEIVRYLRALPPAGSLGVPKAYAEGESDSVGSTASGAGQQ